MRISEYDRIESNSDDDLFLVETSEGTKTIASKDMNFVSKTADEIIGGVKTFASDVIFNQPASVRNHLGLGNTSGVLPVLNGGTGTDTLAKLRNSMGLGNTTGVLGVDYGGTGCSDFRDAFSSLGLWRVYKSDTTCGSTYYALPPNNTASSRFVTLDIFIKLSNVHCGGISFPVSYLRALSAISGTIYHHYFMINATNIGLVDIDAYNEKYRVMAYKISKVTVDPYTPTLTDVSSNGKFSVHIH